VDTGCPPEEVVGQPQAWQPLPATSRRARPPEEPENPLREEFEEEGGWDVAAGRPVTEGVEGIGEVQGFSPRFFDRAGRAFHLGRGYSGTS